MNRITHYPLTTKTNEKNSTTKGFKTNAYEHEENYSRLVKTAYKTTGFRKLYIFYTSKLNVIQHLRKQNKQCLNCLKTYRIQDSSRNFGVEKDKNHMLIIGIICFGVGFYDYLSYHHRKIYSI